MTKQNTHWFLAVIYNELQARKLCGIDFSLNIDI